MSLTLEKSCQIELFEQITGLAAALAIGCPIWTEDADFNGCGVPTWTPSRVAVFLGEPQSTYGTAISSSMKSTT